MGAKTTDTDCLTFARRVPLDKSEGSVKDKPLPRRFSTVVFTREVEDQGSGNLTRQSFPGGTSFHQLLESFARGGRAKGMRVNDCEISPYADEQSQPMRRKHPPLRRSGKQRDTPNQTPI